MAGFTAAVVVAQAQRAILDSFRNAGAYSPATAIAFTPRDRLPDRRLFARLQRQGALVETAPGRFYLDPEGLDRFRSATRKRVLGVLGIGAAVVAGILALT